MTSGQTALAISDLPFMYSLINILFILWTGSVDDFSRFYIVGLFAGLIGAFLVFWHPIQWIIDKNMIKQNENTSFRISYPNASPPEHDVIIDQLFFRLTLKTVAIKYLKDKLVSQFYFIIILSTIFYALFIESFQQTIGLKDHPYLIVIQIIIIAMLVGTGYLTQRQSAMFRRNLKLSALFQFAEYKVYSFGNLTFIKQAIDLGDWVTVEDMLIKSLQSKWGNLAAFERH